MGAYKNVQSHPSVKLWRDAFSALGISGKKYPSSVESLAQRTIKSDPSFKTPMLVDFYNSFSLKYLIPFGGFDMESDVSKNICMRFSKEGDRFLALDAMEPIYIPPGEAVYASGNTVVTRYINWRQSREGLIRESSTDVCFMAEVLDGYSKERLGDMQRDLERCCMDLLDAKVKFFFVNEAIPSITY